MTLNISRLFDENNRRDSRKSSDPCQWTDWRYDFRVWTQWHYCEFFNIHGPLTAWRRDAPTYYCQVLPSRCNIWSKMCTFSQYHKITVVHDQPMPLHSLSLQAFCACKWHTQSFITSKHSSCRYGQRLRLKFFLDSSNAFQMDCLFQIKWLYCKRGCESSFTQKSKALTVIDWHFTTWMHG